MVELQLMTAALIAGGFVIVSLFILKKEYTDGRAWSARLGALFYGVIFAGFVSGVMVPLRLQMMDGEMAAMSDVELILRVVPALIFFIFVVRSDVTGRLPVMGSFIRAYRGAMLRRSIREAEKRLAKMAALEDRALEGV